MGGGNEEALELVVLFSLVVFCCPGFVCCLTEFTLDPKNINMLDFSLQSLVNPSKFPYLTPDGQIFLTQDPTDGMHDSTLYNVGRVTYNKSIQFKDRQHQLFSFNTSFKFNITTATKYNESGDGIAFVMSTDHLIPPNSTGRFLGLMPESPNKRHEKFLAVEFDTFQNLEAEIDDPSASHIGIDVNNLSSVAHLDTSSESHPLYLYHNYTFTAWVSYNASSHLIQVWATNSSDSSQPQEPVVSFHCNLSQVFENYTDIYVGIIAASGNNSQAAILYEWSLIVMDNDHKHLRIWYILVPSVSFICLLATTTYIALRWRQSVRHCRKERATIEMAFCGVPEYKYTQLEKATQKFDEEQVIGRGGFSTVYKGVLVDGTQVAVKRMGDGLVRMEAGMIAREVQIITRIRHRHLLQLKGWCYERGEALLVYDYMPRGSLDSYLYGKKRGSEQTLDSETRFKIIVGVAAALEYMHGDLPGSDRVLHRDVKAANVLLTDTMEAMLADFGLSRLIASDKVVTCTMAGTPGYVAPEVLGTGRVDDKVDVYSFGVLALELACGRRAVGLANSQYSRLVDWVWLRHQSTSILDALDPHLAQSLGFFSSSFSDNLQLPTSDHDVQDQMVQKWRCVLHLGLLCCQPHPDSRPCMREVHQALKDCKVLPPPTSWVPSDMNTAASTSTSRSLSLIHVGR